MKVKIGKYTYRDAKRLKQALEVAPRTEKEVKMFCYLIGVYNTRRFGIVKYLTKSGYDTDKIKIGKKLSECAMDYASNGN